MIGFRKGAETSTVWEKTVLGRGPIHFPLCSRLWTHSTFPGHMSSLIMWSVFAWQYEKQFYKLLYHRSLSRRKSKFWSSSSLFQMSFFAQKRSHCLNLFEERQLTGPPQVPWHKAYTQEVQDSHLIESRDSANKGFHLLGCCAQWSIHWNLIFIIPFYTWRIRVPARGDNLPKWTLLVSRGARIWAYIGFKSKNI
jgi:hypothetical protein